MTYAEYEAKARSIAEKPEETASILNDILTSLKTDLAAAESSSATIADYEEKIRQRDAAITSLNAQLILTRTGSPESSDDDEYDDENAFQNAVANIFEKEESK